MAGNVETAKGLVEKVLAALGALDGGEDGQETAKVADTADAKALPDPAPPAVRSGLTPMAAQDVKSFHSTIRWMLAAFAAVAVVVFGSIPFADVTGEGRNAWRIIVGLVLAGVGVSSAIWATSKVLEPEDASLGELQADLNELGTSTWVNGTHWLHRLARDRLPTTKALRRLDRVLAGPDGINHFGPQYNGEAVGTGDDPHHVAAWRVGRLVDTLGRIDRDRYPAAKHVAFLEAKLVDARAALKLRSEEVTALWEQYAAAVELFSPPDEQDDAGPPANRAAPGEIPPAWAHVNVRVLWEAFRTASAGWMVAWTDVKNIEQQARQARAVLAGIDARSAVHLDRRDTLISESSVSQIRGTFRLARWVLIAGVLATALGVGSYALGLPSGDDATAGDSVMRFTPGVGPPASGTTTVTNLHIRGANGTLAVCSRSDTVLEGVVVGTVDQPTTIVVTGPSDDPDLEVCFGRWVLPAGSWSGDVADDDQPPATSSPDTTVSSTVDAVTTTEG